MLGTTNTEFSLIEVWFTDQNSECYSNYWADIIKLRYSTEITFRKCIKGYDLLPFARKFVDNNGKN